LSIPAQQALASNPLFLIFCNSAPHTGNDGARKWSDPQK
jgi:hypothetical protein